MEERVSLPNTFEPGKLGIATVLYNSSEVLPDFFVSLRSQTYPSFIVYAVDNVSRDNSAELCRQEGPSFVVIEHVENTGFAHGTNVGVRKAMEDGCEFVLLLNNDVVFKADFLALLVEGLKRNNADIVAPLTYYHDRPTVIWAAGGELQLWTGYRPVHLGFNREDCGQFSSDRRITFSPGSCILARRCVFSQIGLLDEVFFTYWEDADFAVRASKQGMRMYLIAGAKLWHKVSSLTGMNSLFQRYYAVRNHSLYIHKHCSPLATKLISGVYLLWYVLSSIRHGKRDPRIKIWQEGLAISEGQKKPV